SPARVCIRACVTDVPGNPLERTTTLGQAFCRKILNRQFQSIPDLLGYDHDHIRPSFDSPNPVLVWFVFDLNVTSELSREQLHNIPHFVYIATRQRASELEFISRDIWVNKGRELAKMYRWGGREEQEELRAMRKS
ncbi:hypothetical protein K505DRAFT_190728, partial [Melanomma pulvis-pyrius CBS 109.77]